MTSIMQSIALRRAYSYMRMICVICFTLSVLPVSGQVWRRNHSAGLNGDNYHFGYVSGSMGYSMLQMSSSSAVSKGALGGSLGIGYEFRNSGFWTSMGVQISMHRSSLLVDQYTRDFDGFDTQGKAAVFHYRVDQTDEHTWNFFDVPIMVGYYIQGFYIGAGPKLSYAIRPTTISRGTYNFSATNTDYNIPFEDMPNHMYTDYAFRSKAANRLNVGVSLIGEIGYDLLSSVGTRSQLCHVLKLGFYFEYGLNNFAASWDEAQPNIVPEQQNATRATVYPYINTLSGRIVPFYAGAKLTYMIGGSRTARAGFHHGCMCYQ